LRLQLSSASRPTVRPGGSAPAFSREAYVPGVLLALEKVGALPPGLTVGLDALLS